MTRIITVFSTIPKLCHYLRVRLPHLTFREILPEKDDALLSLDIGEILVADCNLLIPHIDKLSSVKWIQATWAGVEKLLPHLKDQSHNFTLTRFSGNSFGQAMSEYVIAQIVNFERDQKRQYENQGKHLWVQDDKIANHRLISDLSIGILGVGNIGKCIAERLKTFGAIVWGMTRTASKEKLPYLDEYRTVESLLDILKNCDYIINVLPSTLDTIGLLNDDALRNCKERQPVFINIGRGTIIKETDLLKALDEKWISGAILDVFETEPLPPTSKLWSLPQVTISPHNSGMTRSQDVAKVFSTNFDKYTKGEQMEHVVDLQRGY